MKRTMAIDFDRGIRVANEKLAKNDDIGLFILIALETGLRLNDILHLRKSNFFKRGSEYYIKFTSEKNNASGVRPVSETTFKNVMSKPYNLIFWSDKSNKIYSAMWVGRQLKKAFIKEHKQAYVEDKTISAHSLRKSSGQRIYQAHGLEDARNFLQHKSYQTTRAYLEVSERELNDNISNTLLIR